MPFWLSWENIVPTWRLTWQNWRWYWILEFQISPCLMLINWRYGRYWKKNKAWTSLMRGALLIRRSTGRFECCFLPPFELVAWEYQLVTTCLTFWVNQEGWLVVLWYFAMGKCIVSTKFSFIARLSRKHTWLQVHPCCLYHFFWQRPNCEMSPFRSYGR